MPTLRRPGTVVLWSNCKHPYYDRSVTEVPSYIAQPRERTDRLWLGDIWPNCYAIHKIEAANMRRYLRIASPTRENDAILAAAPIRTTSRDWQPSPSCPAVGCGTLR
jgi:hypothetical protein